MKTYFKIGLTVVVTLLFIAQVDSFAVEKQKYSKLADGKQVDEVPSLRALETKSVGLEKQVAKSKFAEDAERNANIFKRAYNQVEKFWYSIVLPEFKVKSNSNYPASRLFQEYQAVE